MPFTPLTEVSSDESPSGFTPLESPPAASGFTPVAETTPETPLLSHEGLASVGNIAYDALKQAGQTAFDLAVRPSEDAPVRDFASAREHGLKVRALMDAGVPHTEAASRVDIEEKFLRAQAVSDAEAMQFHHRAESSAEIQSDQVPNPSSPLEHAQNIATSFGLTAPALAIGVATKNLPLALAVGTAPQIPLAYDQSRDAGSSHERASVSAGVQGIIEAGGELWPTGKLLAEVGKDAFAKMALKFIGRETVSEVGTTIAQDFAQKVIDNPEQPFGEFLQQLGTDIANTAIETPFVAGLGAGAAHVIDRAMTKTPEAVPETPEQVKSALQTHIDEALKSGDHAKAEVGQQILDMLNEDIPTDGAGGENMGRSIDQTPPQQFTTPDALSPEREALIANPEPLADDELQARVKAAEAAVLPAVQNDGTTAVGLDDALNTDSQIGNTQKVRLNNEPYEENPNDVVPRNQRTVLLGPEGSVGKTLGVGGAATQPGTYVLGEPSVDRSMDVLTGYHEIYDQLRQQFMPNSTIIIANESMSTPQAVGTTQKLVSGEYLIVPAFARNFSGNNSSGTQSSATFNMHTKAKAFYNIFHEFGHALTMERFLEGASPEVQSAFALEQRQGKISDQTIAGLNPEQQALAREFNQFRQEMKTQNAAWFQSQWMSPALVVQRQLIKDMKGLPEMNAESFVRRLVSKGNPTIVGLQAQRALTTNPEERVAIGKQIDGLTSALVNDYLSFDEFMAEKMARYSHETGLGQDSALGKGSYFKGGINYVKSEENLRAKAMNSTLDKIQNSLRALFIALKKGLKLANGQTYRISAGTNFADWVQSLGKVAQAVAPVRTATVLSGEPKEPAPQPKAPLPSTPNNYMAEKLRKYITYGSFTTAQKRTLFKLVRENALNEAHLQMVEYLKQQVVKQLDVNPETGVQNAGALGDSDAAMKAWASQGTESPWFKRWFGDWQADPQQSSKAVTAAGAPLQFFHATKADIETFDSKGIGFHFGDIIAAHARLYRSGPQDVQARIALDEYRGKRDAEGGLTWMERDTGMNIIPAYLNIRNPVEFDERRDIEIWDSPILMAYFLREEGILNTVQALAITTIAKNAKGNNPDLMFASQNRREDFAPLRQMLQHLGYDGIKYKNAVEGGVSWVAFEPEQIKTANGTFSDDPRIHMQIDTDLTNTAGLEMDTLSHVIKKYTDMSAFDKALNWFARSQYSLLQLQQLAWIHPEFYFLELQNAASMQYTAVKSRLQALGESIAQDWKGLSKEADATLSRALEAEVGEGKHWTKLEQVNGQWSHIVTADTLAKLKEHGINIDTKNGRKIAELYLRSKNAMVQHMDAAQITLARQLGMSVAVEGEFMMRLNELKKAFASIREVPFLPRGDYGAWGLVVSEQNGLERIVVHRQMFESNSDMVKARELLEKKLLPGQKIKTITNLPDEHRALLALPREYVENAAEALQMTSSQRDLMFDLLHPVKLDKAIAPYAKAMEKISGGSKDRMRNFADFIWHNSTMIARTEAISAFAKAERAGREMFAEVDAEKGMNETVRLRLLQDIKRAQNYMQNTKDFTLAPPNEWYKVRSAIALTYLWGGVKTAALNLFGIITTHSALSSQYGDLAGNAAFIKANKQLTQLLTKGVVDEGIAALYDRAIKEGFLIQSYAAHLGAAATAGLTRRLANRSRWAADSSRVFQTVADGGMLPFTLAEQYTRRVTFLAVVNAMVTDAKTNGSPVNLDTVYLEAVKQTDLLQNSYTLANRPAIMRGTKSPLIPLATIFMSFTEHLSFNAMGGYTLGAKRRAELLGTPAPKSKISHTQRMLLMLLIFGGYEALPFAGNLLDIMDAFFMGMWGKTARQMIREGVRDATDTPAWHWASNPRYWSRGLGGDVAGYDVSGSLGDGNPIPGTDIAATTPQTAEELAGKALLNITGVTGSMAKWALQTSLDIGKGKSIERNMTQFPGFGGNIASAVQWSQDDAVLGKQGEEVYQPSTAEIAGKALGFTPTGLNEVREQNWAKTEAIIYWTTQRMNLQAAYNQSRDQGDREFTADVTAKIADFNDSVHDAKLKLLPWQLNKSYREHLATQRDKEAGRVPRNVRHLASEVDASFGEGAQSEPHQDVEGN